ncbi:phage neck terminator protein [Brevibacillus ginsengisoli]|uniref:phage neck terminator protein n=1 Tax=Brevibacillus ginsengisoli TaxID=363854 RepID=UPI003CF012E3
MADSVLTLREIEDIFWNCTIRNLGLDPVAKESQKRVRIGYPAEGAPAWKRTENVGFILVTPVDDPISQQVEMSYKKTSETTADHISSYTRVIQVSWTFYGPSSFDDADKVRAGLYRNPILFSPLNLVTSVPSPFRLPELFGGQWWERTSFSARFNEKVVRRSTVNYIESADVQIVPNR